MEGVRGLPQAGRKGRYNGVMFTMTLRRSRRSLSFSRIIFALVLNTRSCRGSRKDVGKYVFGFVTSVCANRNADCLKTKNRFCDIGGGGGGSGISMLCCSTDSVQRGISICTDLIVFRGNRWGVTES